MSDAHKVAELRVTIDGKTRTHDVLLWRGYGAVCPEVVTSNGNAHVVADAIVHYTTHGKEDIDITAEVVSDLNGVDWKDRESIVAALKAKYIELWENP